MKKTSIIVAMDAKNGIGKNNDLMWHLPIDMKFFKSQTENEIVVMGRKNFESIPERFRPLSNRLNVILTRNKDFEADACLVFNNMEDCISALSNRSEKIYIIGGGEIYKQALELNLVEEMFISHVDCELDADTFFPMIEKEQWEINTLQDHPKDEKHTYSFTIKHYKQIKR